VELPITKPKSEEEERIKRLHRNQKAQFVNPSVSRARDRGDAITGKKTTGPPQKKTRYFTREGQKTRSKNKSPKPSKTLERRKKI